MKLHPLLISTNLLESPLAILTISGAGQMFGAQAFLESAMVTYWISRNPTQLLEVKDELEKSPLLEKGKKLLELPEESESKGTQ